MDIRQIKNFFLWCTLINAGILIIWASFCVFAPDFIYHLQSRWLPIPRESFNILIYGFLGVFKIFFLVFNLTPYLALLIIGRGR